MKECQHLKQFLDEEAYNKAYKEYQENLKEYERELELYESEFEPYKFVQILYEKIKEAKERKNKEKQGNNKEEVVAKMKTRIYKMADFPVPIKDKDIPQPDILATYIEALKTYLDNSSNMSKMVTEQIENLPAPAQVKKAYSFEECKLLFETVNYLWKTITKKDIIDESKIEKAPQELSGNYWMLRNGLLLKGTNHISIIKNNSSMFCALLNLNTFTLLQYLSTDANKLIFYCNQKWGR